MDQVMFSAIVLAAGMSRRMGENKLLLPFRGDTILSAVLRSVKDSGIKNRICVSGRDREKTELLALEEGFQVQFNPDFFEGQGTSIRRGIEALSKDSEACFFVMGDQPLLSADSLRGMMEAFEKGSILVPSDGTSPGSPVLFSCCFYEELKGLEGDRGGRQVVEAHPEAIRFYRITKEELMDIDTLEDYRFAL